MLHSDPRLPETWWRNLCAALDILAVFPMNRDNELGAVRYTINGVRQHFNAVLDEEAFTDLTWTTAHADLHWGNLRGPNLCILDWESWRPAPAGYDVATLYCDSLPNQPTAERILAVPVLNTRDGQFALLSVICRFLNTAGEGSDLDQLDDHL